MQVAPEIEEIQQLDSTCERQDFDCGVPELNEFLRSYASQNERKGMGRTYVALEKGSRRVIGYYTVSAGQVDFEYTPASVRKGLPRYPIPVIHLARLAVDASFHRHGLGHYLLVHCLTQALRVADLVGVKAIEVRAKNDLAKEFYSKRGFVELEDDKLHMYVTIASLCHALESL